MAHQRKPKGKPKVNLPASLEQLKTHGAYFISRAYLAGEIDRRTSFGFALREWENEFAQHLGCKVLAEVPIVARTKVQLLISNLLFLQYYEPALNAATSGRETSWREGLINRILTELGLQPAAKQVPTLQDYLKAREADTE